MFSITTINHKTYDSQHPLLMITNREGHRYFFGKISEGTQRVLNDKKIRLSKLKGLFLTGILDSWSQVGGLPGLFLTISDSTKKDVEVFTNSGKLLTYIVACWRYFVFRKGVKINIQDVSELPESFIGDSNLMIKPIKIANDSPIESPSNSTIITRQLKKLVSLMFPLDTSEVNSQDPESYKSDPADKDIQTHVSIEDFNIQLHNQDQKSLNYIIEFVPIRGKFDVEKAKSLGIKPGLSFRDLTNGISVRNEQNQLIEPHQVIGQNKSFHKVIILDIPNQSYLKNTLQHDWTAPISEESETEEIGLVYHLLGDDIDFNSDQYTEFIKTFPPTCQHIISHSELADNTLVFRTFSIHVLKLRSILKTHFNLPYSESFQPLDTKNIVKLHQLQKYVINPHEIIIDNSQIFNHSWSELYDENIVPLNLPGIDKQQVIDPEPISLDAKNTALKDNVQVTTLGTGSALPSLQRNVISNLVRLPFAESGKIQYKSVILDGGENTLASLLRTFGHQQQYIQILEELSLIFLSHLHADHHLGLISIINKWFDVNASNDKILHLVTPWQYDHFLNEWYKLEGHKNIDVSRINYISCEDFIRGRVPEYKKIDIDTFERNFDLGQTKLDLSRDLLKPLNHQGITKLYDDLNISELSTCRAIHCYWAYSVSIKFKLNDEETFKVSYSGDTRPNSKFVDIGYDSDLLIHEASLDNGLIEEAISKKHSTMIEAVNVARYMNCPRVILTHFSARYSNKSNFITGEIEFTRLSNELKEYLQDYSHNNIYQLEDKVNRPIKSFNELEILFASDTMITRLDQIKHQKPVLALMAEILDSESDTDNEKELEKQRIKREAKRMQRLALQQKKRKVIE